MGKKMMLWKTKGMNQDLSVSAFNPEFSFENMNLRLSTNEGNTLMSWVNERGTQQLFDLDEYEPEYWSKDGTDIYYDPHDSSWQYHAATGFVSLDGHVIGTAVLNHQLIVFTTGGYTMGLPDAIYRLEVEDPDVGIISVETLFKGNLQFNTDYPLETLVSYESEDIQKVYWVDGRNQPRVINIANFSPYILNSRVETRFDFLPELNVFKSASITKRNGGGTFAPGVIQYCFTYFNKHGQESNIVWVSPLQYISFPDRGASPEEKVSCNFHISIPSDSDYTFEYVRIYSIQRTSLNLDPIVKILIDLPLSDEEDITYVDNGTTGAIIDPRVLLFVGGKEITAMTLADKDNTLFLGNITEKHGYIDNLQEQILSMNHTFNITFRTDGGGSIENPIKHVELNNTPGIYSYTQMIADNSQAITTFKGGETYRLGFQLQTKTGQWSEPIFLKDVLNEKYPFTTAESSDVYLPYVSYTLSIRAILGYNLNDYVRVRPLIVYPTISDRHVLCQGVLNPTVFNVIDRKTNSPFAQASWFFRPYTTEKEQNGESTDQSKILDTVVTTAVTDSTTITPPPPEFVKAGLLKNMYILVCKISEENDLETILKNRCLTALHNVGGSRTMEKSSTGIPSSFGVFRKENSNRRMELPISFSGAICLDSGAKVYAFLKETSWTKPYGDPTSEYPSFVYTGGVTEVDTVEVPFKLYSGMKVSSEGYYYYPGDTGTTYDFQFYTERYLYTVPFKGLNIKESLTIDGSSTGSQLRFMHYDSLFSRSDLQGDDSTKISAACQIEIQGAEELYKTPFDSLTTTSTAVGKFGGARNKTPDAYTANRNAYTNTQFFIDQSIVTLNSPDIDFDPELQSYGLNNVKLRVIGAIPITGGVSSHKITTSSNMLETSHNEDIETNDTATDGKFGGSNMVHKYFGSGELAINTLYKNNPGPVTHVKHLVSEYLWNDIIVSSDTSKDDKITTTKKPYDFLISPWQRNGSLNNDWRTQDTASSWLKTKKMSNLLYSHVSLYGDLTNNVTFNDVASQTVLTENDWVMNYRLPKQVNGTQDINYYANIDKVLFNEHGYETMLRTNLDTEVTAEAITSPISMKYRSTSHAVIALQASGSDSTIPILPYTGDAIGKYDITKRGKPFWDNTESGTEISFSQKSLSNTSSSNYDFLWIGELTQEPINNFGGTERSAIQSNKWTIGGEAVDLVDGTATLIWTEGDTYFQRYDCLKTYPFTPEDTNQIVEILSFMCETHVNIDGRYDRNRGQVDNTNMSPRNFNLMNPVYSQRNNFFTYRQLDHEGETSQSYPNQVIYSMTKNSAAEVDEWTHVTLANTLELDGDKGKLNKLTRFNDQLLAFQDTGISQILYNESTAISSTAGVPIEIANSGKVTGKRYLSDTIGCSNKWSLVQTPSGVYFMDNHNQSIYLFNGQLENLSTKFGFNSWCKRELKEWVVWEPYFRYYYNSFRGLYDNSNQDVLFVGRDNALAFSEKFGCFTSFYDYGGKGYLEQLDNIGIWFENRTTRRPGMPRSIRTTAAWGHQMGNYGRFFGENKPYWMTLVGNPEPQVDKMFTNLEFRACVDGEMVETQSQQTEPSLFLLPFDELEVWNEYQHGKTLLHYNGMPEKHFSGNDSALKRKFRIWRCDIPRDNAPVTEEDEAKGIYRTKVRPLDRIRNTWVYLKLMKNAPQDDNVSLPRTEVHDMGLGYF